MRVNDIAGKMLSFEQGASEPQFRILAENLPDNIIRFDRHARVVYMNPAMRQSIPPAILPVIGEKPTETFPDDEFAAFMQRVVEGVLQMGEGVEFEIPVPGPHGETRMHHVRYVAERDGNGEIHGALGIGRDITEQKQAEDKLRASEQEFRSLAESAPDFIIRYDSELRIRYLNNRLLIFMGLASAEEVIGKRPGEAWPDGRYAMIEAAAQQVIETGEAVTLAPVFLADQSKYHHISIVPERDVQGRVIGAIIFAWDVTAIREIELRLTHFVENLPGMAYTFRLTPDGHGSVPFASAKIEEFYGLRHDEVKDDAAPILDLLHPDDRLRNVAAIAESARAMAPFHLKYRICRPGLPERWAEARAVPERELDGSIVWYGMVLDITEQKQAQEFAENLLNAIPDPIFAKDRQHKWVAVNDAFCALMGQPREALIGQSDYDYLPVSEADALREKDEIVFASGKEMLSDEVITDAEGRVRFVQTKKNLVGANMLVGSIRDLTDIMENQRMLDEAQKIAQLGSWDWNIVKDSVVWSEMAYEIYTPDERPASPRFEDFTQAVYPDDRELVLAAVSMAFEHDTPYDIEHRVVSESKGIRTVHAQGKVFRNEHGRPVRMVGLVHDITERKRAEQRLIHSEQQFRSLAESLPDPLIRYDRQGRRTFLSRIAKERGAVTDEQALGKTPAESKNVITPESYRIALAHTLASGERSEVEVQLQMPSGDLRTYQCYIVPEWGENGQVTGAINISRDITELKQAERRLRDLNAHLQSVREEEKGRLARELHDELGSLLAALKMETNILARSLTADGTATSHAGRIESILLLIDEAMGFSRRVVNELRPTVLDVLGLLPALEWQADQFSRHTGIECRVECTSRKIRNCESCNSCDDKLVDPLAITLFRVAQEALTNVSKHSGASQAKIDYQFNDNEIVLAISDNGRGLPEDIHVTATSHGLRGMRERVAQIDGAIDIANLPDGGLEVAVRLPLSAVARKSGKAW